MPINRIPVHPDHIQERFFVLRHIRARSNGFGDPRTGQIRLAAHDRGNSAGKIAALIAVVRNPSDISIAPRFA